MCKVYILSSEHLGWRVHGDILYSAFSMCCGGSHLNREVILKVRYLRKERALQSGEATWEEDAKGKNRTEDQGGSMSSCGLPHRMGQNLTNFGGCLLRGS
jgi:hypothetical protein